MRDIITCPEVRYAVAASQFDKQDRIHRRLLKAGKREVLALKLERLTSRKLQAGSRIVLILGINKRPDEEINYGTSGDVSNESLESNDNKVPVKIRWYNDSYIECRCSAERLGAGCTTI